MLVGIGLTPDVGAVFNYGGRRSLSPPNNIVPPDLSAAPLVGTTLSLASGVWSGEPAPSIRAELLVRGVARAVPYLVSDADDGAEIIVREHAVNTVGAATASSAPAVALRRAPEVSGSPEDVTTTHGAPEPTRALATLYANAVGGAWTVTVDGVVDPARASVDQNGVVTIRTTTAWAGTVVGSYANSGGAAACSFDVVVRPVAPAQMAAPVVAALSASALMVDRAAAPADGGAAVASYDLRWSVDQTNWTVLAGVADPHTVTGLSAGTLHHVQTRAVNAVGPGPWSVSGAATTWGVPAAMSAPTLAGGVEQATIAFAAAPAANGAPVTLYGWEVATAADASFAAPVAAGTQADRSLPVIVALAEGPYLARTRAQNAVGWSPWSAPGAAASVAAAPSVQPPTHDGTTLPSVTIVRGVAIAPINGANGFSGADVTFSATGLPAGLTLDPTTGMISGAPLAFRAAAPVVVTAANLGGSVSAPAFDLAVEGPEMLIGQPIAGALATLPLPQPAGGVRVESVSGARTTFYWTVSLEDGATYRVKGDYIRRSSSGNAQLFRVNADADIAGATFGAFDLQISSGGYRAIAAGVAVEPNPFSFTFTKIGADAAASIGFVSTVPHPFSAEFKNLSLRRTA